MSAKYRVNLGIFAVALFVVCKTTKCIILIRQWFCLRRRKGPSVLLSARAKMVAIKFHKNQKLNLGNQYHKDAINVTPETIEKF